jgi:hypothetical protein
MFCNIHRLVEKMRVTNGGGRMVGLSTPGLTGMDSLGALLSVSKWRDWRIRHRYQPWRD